MTFHIDLISRQKQRGRQRGAAMVEAAFMFPMFVIMFFSIVYAHSFSSTQIDANTQSRQLAWNDAMSNCTKTGSADQEQLPPNATSLTVSHGNFESTNSSNPITTNTNETNSKLNKTSTSSDTTNAMQSAMSGGSLEGAFGAILGPILNAVASILPDPEGAQATAKANISYRLPNNYAGLNPNNSTTISQITTIPCNLAPQAGGLAGIFNEIKGAVSGP
jgi:cytoskeletal protein RodZ